MSPPQVSLLDQHKELNDFGREVMPYAVASGLKVMGVQLDGPWQVCPCDVM